MVRDAVRLAVSQPDNTTHKLAQTHTAQPALRRASVVGVDAEAIML